MAGLEEGMLGERKGPRKTVMGGIGGRSRHVQL